MIICKFCKAELETQSDFHDHLADVKKCYAAYSKHNIRQRSPQKV